jgi:hypothetical protein
MGIIMSGCGCSKETPCEDKQFQQENNPSISKECTSKNCDSTPSCCCDGDEKNLHLLAVTLQTVVKIPLNPVVTLIPKRI